MAFISCIIGVHIQPQNFAKPKEKELRQKRLFNIQLSAEKSKETDQQTLSNTVYLRDQFLSLCQCSDICRTSVFTCR